MNGTLLSNNFCCIESDSPESFVKMIDAFPTNGMVHREKHEIIRPDSTRCFGLIIDGDHDAVIDLISLFCAQKGVIWGELSNRTFYFSDGNVFEIDSCTIREVA